ncbi:343_t:CDS:10, partial [Acaulospora morrowiae]
ILNEIRSVQPPGGWKVVIVDEPSRKIMDSAVKMYDILEEKVTLVESLEKPRQAYQTLEAVYIITPSEESVARVIDDCSKQKAPLYAGAHLFFISSISPQLKAKLPPAYVKTCKELYIDFHAKEARVFSFESPSSYFNLYSPKKQDKFDLEIRNLAKKLLSICISLGENPLIRYQRGLDAEHPTKSLPYKLAMLVQQELDDYVKFNHNGFPLQDPQRPRAVLFIADRTIDMCAPLLHEFTYQAMANDLLPIEDGNKYTYNYTGEDGEQAATEAILDDTDNVWVDNRHKHMKECIDKLIKDFNEFLGEHTGFTDKEKAANLNDMKKMLATLPQFQSMKEKLSVHMSIAQECMAMFERERLSEIAIIEQNCATGFTADFAHPKTLVEDMVPLLDNPVVSSTTKVRMLMLYIMYKNGILEEDRRKLLAHAQISLSENDAINNLGFFGVKLIRKPKKYRQKQGEEMPYEISRYIPKLKLVLESHIDKTIDHTAYPYTKDPTGDPDGSKATQQGPVSLRSARAGWYKKGQAAESRAGRIIVFVAGGVSYSELRSCYELSDKHRLDVIIGSTHLVNPKNFINDLSLLLNPPSEQKAPPLPARPSSQENQTPPGASRPSPSGGYVSQVQSGYSQYGYNQQQSSNYAQGGYSRPNQGYQNLPQSMPASNQQYINVPRPPPSSSTQSDKTKPKSNRFKF